MDFETFKENIANDLQDALTDRTGKEYEVRIQPVEKMNESYEAITIKPVDGDIGVNVNATSLYEAVENGKPYDTALDRAADMAEGAFRDQPDFDIAAFSDYSRMKNTLAMEVVSAERNAALLETVPHKDMEDMAVVYRFVVGDTPGGTGTILVTNQMLDNYGITAEQLHEDAMRNAPEIRPMVIEGMAEVLAKQMGVENVEAMEQDVMLVATVEGNVHGAGVLAYEDFMDKAAERVDGSFFILPSSVHEILIIPDNGQFDLRSLENMVREVNATTVDPVDKLTDNVYHYDADAKVFELGEKFVERQAALAETKAERNAADVTDRAPEVSTEKTETKGSAEKASIAAGEKRSILGELKANKDAIAGSPKKDAVEKAVKSRGGAEL